MVSIAHSVDACQRIALINPTKFLGNLLIAGDLIQALARECRRRDVSLLLVLDHRYRALLEPAFRDTGMVWYPREVLKRPGDPRAWAAWWRCLYRIRTFRADLAFPVEDDSVAHQLTRLSGARHRVATSTERHSLGFHEVLDVPRGGRRPPDSHMWFSYRDVLERLGLAGTLPDRPAYIRLPSYAGEAGGQGLADPDRERQQRPVVALHAGATKTYKMWPLTCFSELAVALVDRGYRLVLIGAGKSDAAANLAIREGAGSAKQFIEDLCDRLTLPQLAGLLRSVEAVVGNDSGPMHLAGAVGARGVVVFGPTDMALWHPLSDSIRMVENRRACDPRCRRRVCFRNYACLRGISPGDVLDSLPLRPL